MDQNGDHPISRFEFRVLLIDFSPNVYSQGVRSIAAYLREKGIHVDISGGEKSHAFLNFCIKIISHSYHQITY
jgi:hypothetical protein